MDAEHDLMKFNKKETPLPHQSVEEMNKDKPVCVLHLKVERSEDVDIIEGQPLRNLEGIKSENFVNKKDIKQELQEDFKRNEFINIKNIKQEAVEIEIDFANGVHTNKESIKQKLLQGIDVERDGLISAKDIKKEEVEIEINIESDQYTDKNDIKQEKLEKESIYVERNQLPEDYMKHKKAVGLINNIERDRLTNREDSKNKESLKVQNLGTRRAKGSVTDSEYESGASGPSTKKKLRMEIVHNFKPSETQSTSTDNESRRFNKAPKTSTERSREFRARKALLKQQSKQQQEPDAIEIATEDIRSVSPSEDNQVPGPSEIRAIEKRAKAAEARRRWREKKRALVNHQKKQAKTAAQRMREYRERKNRVKLPLAERKRYECETCQRRFTRKYFKIHLRTHTGEKPFECEICRRRFGRRSFLNTHIRTHTGEIPFECKICKRKFNEKHHLSSHVRTHTGDKPFECETCHQKFGQNSTLNTHLRTHTGEKPFECNICNQRFGQKSTLNTHLRRHTGEKPFVCEICQQKFTSKSNLSRHSKTHAVKKPV